MNILNKNNKPKQPNEETIAALQEAERISKDPTAKGYTNIQELFEALENEQEI